MSDMALGTSTMHGSRTPRWMVVLLVASLALNLLVIGMVGTLMWRTRIPPPWARTVTPNLLGYASTLPAERRQELWELTAKEREHVRPFRREVRAARDETVRALSAESFDRQRFLAAHARQMEVETRAREAVRDLYMTIAATLTPEERQGFQHWRTERRRSRHNMLDEDPKGDDASK
jgi:uncharacterized membrane protein